MSNGLAQDQDRHPVAPDLGPTVCKGDQQRLSADDKNAASKERVKLDDNIPTQKETMHTFFSSEFYTLFL